MEYQKIKRQMQRLAVTLLPSTEKHVYLVGGMMACLEEFDASVLAQALSQDKGQGQSQGKSQGQGKDKSKGGSSQQEDGTGAGPSVDDDRIPMEDVEAMFTRFNKVGSLVDE